LFVQQNAKGSIAGVGNNGFSFAPSPTRYKEVGMSGEDGFCGWLMKKGSGSAPPPFSGFEDWILAVV